VGGLLREEDLRVRHRLRLGKRPAGFRLFYQDPKANPLQTPSGLLEFYSERLAQQLPRRQRAPAVPKWVPKGITHDEDLSSERADMFPLLLMSNHPRWRTHAQGDDISWTRETPTGKVLGFDGYKYEPIWINPTDAESRGIKHGDVVKIFNERGIVLVGARVWERIRPGVVYVDHGSRHDPLVPARSTAVGPSTPSPQRSHLQERVRTGDQRLPGRRAEGQERGMGNMAQGLS